MTLHILQIIVYVLLNLDHYDDIINDFNKLYVIHVFHYNSIHLQHKTVFFFCYFIY